MKHLITDKNGDTYTLRIAEVSDLPALNGIYNMAIRSRRCTGHMEEFGANDRYDWFLSHDPKKYPIYVAEREGRIVGYIHISPYIQRQAFAGDVEITYYLDLDLCGRGIGSGMMEFMLRETRRLGYTHVIGTLLSINERSIGLLEKFGFRKWGCLPGIMNMGNGITCDFLIYGLNLQDDRSNNNLSNSY